MKANSVYKGKTLEEIVEMSVHSNGYELLTDAESICDMQDAIAKLPNDDYEAYVSKCLYSGRNHQKVIMAIVALAHSALDAAELYSRIANRDFREERDEFKEKANDLSKKYETALANAHTLNHWLAEEKERANDLEKALQEKDQEILILKAKLYDMMTK